MVLAPYYRRFELPWEGDPEASRRFRLLVSWGLALFFVFAVVTHFVKFPEPERTVTAVPDRLARLMVQERPRPPPPPPPPPVVEEPKPVEQQPEPEPVPQPPEQRQEQARRRAEAQLANVRDELASIRESLSDQPVQSRNLTTGTVGAESRAERSLITSRAGTGSAGVASSSASRGFGAGAGALSGHTTGTVESSVATASASAVSRGSSGKPGRGAEEIEQEFDRNKGAIYGLYIRALREQADLQGKVVLEFTIAPEGAVTACRVVSSELNNPELEGRICARVRGFRFPARDVAAVTTTKPIDFFPQG